MRVPWRDRHGRFQPLKAATLIAAFIPGLLYIYWLIDGDLGGRRVNALIHGSGSWAVRFLVISLAITPLARLAEKPVLLTIRRMVGLTALAYASIHLALYIVDEKFAPLTIVTEIALRFYLTIGFVALIGLAALGWTSTDAAMKRMGKKWKQLHRLAYPIGVLALLHFFIQTKANVGQPLFVSGLFVWLMLWRALPMAKRTSAVWLFALAPVCGLVTMGLEFAWYGLATKLDPFRILTANWTERFFPRPAHEVFAAALLLAVALTARRVWSRRGAGPGMPVRVTAR
jgi:sulfoxide reductase heme-binding subunit YedZ